MAIQALGLVVSVSTLCTRFPPDPGGLKHEAQNNGDLGRTTMAVIARTAQGIVSRSFQH